MVRHLAESRVAKSLVSSGLIAVLLVIPACKVDPKEKKMVSNGIDSGSGDSMNRYRIGRFSLSLPQTMMRRGQSYKVQYCELSEQRWSSGSEWKDERDSVWQYRLSTLQKLKPPRKDLPIVISEREMRGVDSWMKGVLYYGLDYTDERIVWEALLATRPVGLWLKKDAWKEYTEEVASDLSELASAYRSVPQNGPWFFLEHGAIALPYFEQEELYVRFEDSAQGLKFEAKTKSVDEVERVGLLARIGSALASGYAPGVEVEQVHMGKRKVAACEGEEAILIIGAGIEKKLSFIWSFQGKEDSGEYPQIVLSMESDDVSVEEKRRFWDSILDSMDPIAR